MDTQTESPRVTQLNALLTKAAVNPDLCKHYLRREHCAICTPPKVTVTYGRTPQGKIWVSRLYRYADLRDCQDHIDDDDLSPEEKRARDKLAKICREIADSVDELESEDDEA